MFTRSRLSGDDDSVFPDTGGLGSRHIRDSDTAGAKHELGRHALRTTDHPAAKHPSVTPNAPFISGCWALRVNHPDQGKSSECSLAPNRFVSS